MLVVPFFVVGRDYLCLILATYAVLIASWPFTGTKHTPMMTLQTIQCGNSAYRHDPRHQAPSADLG
jgi:hypothetical protein